MVLYFSGDPDVNIRFILESFSKLVVDKSRLDLLEGLFFDEAALISAYCLVVVVFGFRRLLFHVSFPHFNNVFFIFMDQLDIDGLAYLLEQHFAYYKMGIAGDLALEVLQVVFFLLLSDL